jgi:hypothetical protein
VLGRVEVEQDEPLHVERLLGDGLRMADDRGLFLARVQIAEAGDLEHVRVLGDHPVALVVETGGAARLGVPPDRRRAPQLRQFIRGHPARVQVGIGEVEARGDARLGHRCLPL